MENIVKSTFEVVYYFNIQVLNPKRDIVEHLSWSGLKWELRLKYNWYFKYRAALIQVKYPKFEVQIFMGNEPAQGKTLQQLEQSKIKSKKAKITEYKNKLQKAKESWSSFFPIEEDELYKKAANKINRLELELISLCNNINN